MNVKINPRKTAQILRATEGRVSGVNKWRHVSTKAAQPC